MSDPNLPALPIGHTVGCGELNGQKVLTKDEARAYGEACAAAEREAAARICEKYFHTTCAKVIRRRGGT